MANSRKQIMICLRERIIKKDFQIIRFSDFQIIGGRIFRLSDLKISRFSIEGGSLHFCHPSVI